MNHLLQAFLDNALRRCGILRENLRRLDETQSNSARRKALLEVFRQVHTLKGSAAAFELEAISRLAHDVEQLVENFLSRPAFETKILDECLAELEHLLKAAQRNENLELSNKIERWRAECVDAQRDDKRDAPVLPAEYFNRLKSHEQLRVESAANQNAPVLLLEANLPIIGFAENFRQLHARVSENHEIVATLPDVSSATGAEKIKMHLICVAASAASDAPTENFSKDFAVLPNCRVVSVSRRESFDEIERQSNVAVSQMRLSEVWAMPFAAAVKAANKAGKAVQFETRGGEIKISAALIEACQTVLLHLLRNAVVHGIEPRAMRRSAGKTESGTISIEATRENANLHLKISDDGSGIDADKVWQIAIERGVLDNHRKFDRSLAKSLIFEPGFSTAAVVSHEAGRGIGLDAVVSAIKEVGGDLEVESEPGRGTSFSLRLPVF